MSRTNDICVRDSDTVVDDTFYSRILSAAYMGGTRLAPLSELLLAAFQRPPTPTTDVRTAI